MRPFLHHRLATLADVPKLERLISSAISHFLPLFLDPAQVSASVDFMRLDETMIANKTFFIVEAEGAIVGCGGWSRETNQVRSKIAHKPCARLPNDQVEQAWVRSMYTDPAFARRGVGRRILELCEATIANEGFRQVELAATKSGEPLYRACGYQQLEILKIAMPCGVAIPLVRMRKAL